MMDIFYAVALGRLFIVVDTSRQESYDKCICSMTQTESVSETL